MRGLWVALLMQVRALLIVTAFACGGSQNGAHVAKPEPSITVVGAGAEPRQRIRYELTAHSPERVEMTFKLRMNTAFTNTVLQSGHRSVDFPTLRYVARSEVSTLTPAGDAVVTFELEEGTVLDDVVDPAIRKLAIAEVAFMKGSRGSWRRTPSGRISDIAFDAPNASSSARNLISTIADSTHETAVVFPDTAIGVGARWQVTSQQSSSGVQWSRTVTYELKSLTDSVATIDAQMVMHAPSQALSVEPNATTKLTSGSGNATAELIVPLHSLIATTTARQTSETNLLIVRGHLRITSTILTEILSSVKPLAVASTGNEPTTGNEP
jgi:hypothetical protein